MYKFVKKMTSGFMGSYLRGVVRYFRRIHIYNNFRRMYRHDRLRYLKYSRTLGSDNREKLIGTIILQYHVIEKGLTMPKTRPGFGQERVTSLCKACLNYVDKYGLDDVQLKHAIGVVLEYEEFQKEQNFPVKQSVADFISKVKSLVKSKDIKVKQIITNRTEYFKYINSPFPEFSGSRSSVRNYSKEEVPLIKIQKALEIARNTPSACNRQSWRTYIIIDRHLIGKVLEEQGGNRGFGHLIDKLIVVTGELGGFCYTNERHQVFIDGGMYAMNLLYALHYNEIAVCIMNCSFDYQKEQYIKQFVNIKESEVLIAMIGCGIPPEEFKIAVSTRYGTDRTNKLIDSSNKQALIEK